MLEAAAFVPLIVRAILEAAAVILVRVMLEAAVFVPLSRSGYIIRRAGC